MERRLEKFGDVVEKFLQESDLAFATIDNINIYHGIVTHPRLFKRLGPKCGISQVDTCFVRN